MATALEDTKWRKKYTKMSAGDLNKSIIHLDQCIARTEKDIGIGKEGAELFDLLRERDIAVRVEALKLSREAQGRNR